MDYLTRDSKISGPNYGNVEISRLLNTMMIHDNHLVFKDKSIAAIENFLIGRYHMYEILYMHPKNLGFDQLMIFIFNRLRVMKKNGHRFITNIEILDPIIESKFTTESLYKLTDFSATSIIEELIKEEDVILNKLIDSFQKGKVLKYETLETKAAEESFKKRFKKEEEGFL
jgi:HD superfamily phosphohydrolase